MNWQSTTDVSALTRMRARLHTTQILEDALHRIIGTRSAARFVKVLAILLLAGLGSMGILQAQVVPVGAGAYTTTLPTGATAPQSTIYTTQTGPVQTHKYWTSKLWTPLNNNSSSTNNTAGFNIIPQPLTTTVTAQGMLVGVHGDVDGYPGDNGTATAFYQYNNFDLMIGHAGLNAASVNISASSDWSADFNFGPSLTIRTGRGMPFAYALTDGTPVTVTFSRTPTVVTNNANILLVSTTEGDTRYTNYYGLFCPTGGAWAQNGFVFTCTPPSGSNYASVALLPGLKFTSPVSGLQANANQTTLAAQLADYTKVAFSFPTNTQVSWSYNESTSKVSTTYTITTQSMDGKSTGFLSALYPTQYDSLPAAVNTPYTYLTNHGTMEVNSGTSFTTIDTFHGVLPFMPPTTNYDMAKLKTYVDAAPAAALSASDYEQGKILGATAQVLPLATLADPAAYTTLQTSLQTTLQTWFTATPSATADLFYYDSTWGTMIGYPASFGSDNSLNDHHFHYGYFIHASAVNGLFNPTWVTTAKYGGMVRLLQQDIGNYDRTNTMFPFLRHFDVYAGHSWASGTAPFGDGENEESSSEAVNAWTGMILLGAATGDTALRDAGIWLYTQETKGVAYYWFNEQPGWVNANAASTYPKWFAPLRIANEYDDKGDEATFFGTNPDFEHAIEFLPFTGGSLHLGLSPSYVQKNYNEDVAANIAASKPAGDWPDLMAEYEALSNPATALAQWQTVTSPTDGETLAHEYAWISSLQALGQVDSTVTANTPYYAVFNSGGTISHVAFNPSTSPVTVTFSDNATLMLPADTMASDSPLVTSFTFGAGIVTVQPPAAPTGVTATAKSGTEIDLTWTPVSGLTYDVYRGTTSGFTPSPANMVASSLTAGSYSDLGLSPTTAYYYVVEAVNSGGNSPASSEVTSTTAAAGTGGAVPETNTLYLLGGATVTNPSLLSFTAGASGVDNIPANNPQSPNVVTNPLVYTITGVNGTYDSAMTTAFNLYVDAATNAGEAAQVEVLYDLAGSGTFSRTELYSLFATNAAVDYEDYMQTSRGGLLSATGTLGNMTNGTIVIKVWSALPGVNSAPIALSVGNNPVALSDLVIPFTSVSQTLSAPVTPTGLAAVAVSGSAINLSWMPSSTVGVTYSVYRSTTSGFVPSAANMIASGLSGKTYSDVNLTVNTTYNYVVEAVNGLGNSAPSAPASATTLIPTGPVSGSNVLYLVSGATQTSPSLISFVGGPAGMDTIPINNPQSPDTPMNPLVYTMTGVSGTYDNTMSTAFNLFLDAGVNPGEAAQVEVLYDLTGSGTFSRTELYHFFATDPVLGYEDYTQSARGGLETATGSLGDMTNGTIVVKVWNALPGTNAVPMSLSVGTNPNALSDLVIPFNSVTQTAVAPTAPTSVVANAKSYSEVDLSWTASTTPSVSYTVYRSTVSGFTPGTGNSIGTVPSTSFADTTVAGSTTYYYVIAAVNGAGKGLASPVSITTPPAPIATTTSLSLSAPSVFLGGTETLTAAVTPSAATGTIVFKDGGATLKTVPLSSGMASFTTSALAGGSHSFTASYSGDATYSASSSAPQVLSVPTVAPDFAIAAAPANSLVGAGQSTTYTLTLTPVGGFNSAISLSCSGLPLLSTCSFNPATVTLNGAAASTSTMTISTTGTSTTAMVTPLGGGKGMRSFYLAFLPLGLGMFVFGRKQRRKMLRGLLVGSATLSVMCMFLACSSSKPSTPTSVNTITITATAGSTTHTTTVDLVVQQY